MQVGDSTGAAAGPDQPGRPGVSSGGFVRRMPRTPGGPARGSATWRCSVPGGLDAEIQADAFLGAAGVDAAVGHGGVVPAFAGNGFAAGLFVVGGGGAFHEDEVSVFREGEHVAVDEDRATLAEAVVRPFFDPGGQLDAFERHLLPLLEAEQAVEMAVLVDRSAPVIHELIRLAPFFG